MVKENLLGKMVKNMTENINMMKNMGLEYLHGLIAEDMKYNIKLNKQKQIILFFFFIN